MTENAFTVLIAALLVNVAFAGIPILRDLLSAPERGLAGALDWFKARLDRANRSASNRLARGAVVLAILLVPALLLAWLVEAARAAFARGDVIEILVMATLLPTRPAFDGMRAMAKALSGRGLEAGRAVLATQVAYVTDGLDDHALARGGIEAGMVRLCDALVGPAFWFLLFGWPGVCIYAVVNRTAARLGRPGAPDAAFGAVADRLDRLANLVPGPISGVVIGIAAAFVPGADPFRAFATLGRDWRLHPTPGRGFVLAASAGALGLALAGPRRYGEAAFGAPWIGSGRARVNASDVARAAYLLGVSVLVALAVLAGGLLLAAG